MKFILMIHGNESAEARRSESEMKQIVGQHMKVAQELRAAGKMVHGERLRGQAEATRIRSKAGQIQVTDGPFAETKEAIGGFYLIDCASRRRRSSGPPSFPSARRAISKCGRSGRCSDGLGGAGFLVEHVFRASMAARRLGRAHARDLDAAEETVQEALAAALVHWPVDGLPDNPGAWLMTVARNRARDHLRRRRRLHEKIEALAREGDGLEEPTLEDDPAGIPDDRLRLIFTCCHPALAPRARWR
jgi:hypothetical protein